MTERLNQEQLRDEGIYHAARLNQDQERAASTPISRGAVNVVGAASSPAVLGAADRVAHYHNIHSFFDNGESLDLEIMDAFPSHPLQFDQHNGGDNGESLDLEIMDDDIDSLFDGGDDDGAFVPSLEMDDDIHNGGDLEYDAYVQQINEIETDPNKRERWIVLLRICNTLAARGEMKLKDCVGVGIKKSYRALVNDVTGMDGEASKEMSKWIKHLLQHYRKGDNLGELGKKRLEFLNNLPLDVISV